MPFRCSATAEICHNNHCYYYLDFNLHPHPFYSTPKPKTSQNEKKRLLPSCLLLNFEPPTTSLSKNLSPGWLLYCINCRCSLLADCRVIIFFCCYGLFCCKWDIFLHTVCTVNDISAQIFYMIILHSILNYARKVDCRALIQHILEIYHANYCIV